MNTTDKTIVKKYGSKKETTLLSGGLTLLQDQLIEVALKSIGENYVSLPNPDFESFQKGKMYGNRGQCNPTYFTVGNLIKYLHKLCEEKNLSKEDIVYRYAYVTAGGCGPCRFGMYITEYKKALRDAGFEGFRIISFEHNKGLFQKNKSEEDILELSPKFFIVLIKALIIGDIINILGYKMRPYEVEKGSIDRAMIECRSLVSKAFLNHTNLIVALLKCRSLLKKIELNRLEPKAKVLVMGEFWAAITESDGNYNLHRFLEEEGAECITQPLINTLMRSLWEAERKLKKVEGIQSENSKAIDFSSMKTKILIRIGKATIKTYFYLYAKTIGLNDYRVPDMEQLAKLAEGYYSLDCNGGEGHLEVAHLLESIEHNLAHLVISVKPFGCMPSSSVSDGVQSLIVSKYPSANFLSLETSGEGAANFYSRVQMALFKAKQSAKEEFEALNHPISLPEKLQDYLYQPKSKQTGTAAQLIESI